MKLKKSRFGNNAQALLWRMLLFHKKYWICTILKIVLPCLLFGILVAINSFSPRLLRSEIEVKTYKNEDLLGEIVKELNTTKKPAVILFGPENNLTRDLTNQISLSLNFLIENVLTGASNFGNYFFKGCLISNSIFLPFYSKKYTKKNIYLSVFPVWTIYLFVFLKFRSKSNLYTEQNNVSPPKQFGRSKIIFDL